MSRSNKILSLTASMGARGYPAIILAVICDDIDLVCHISQKGGLKCLDREGRNALHHSISSNNVPISIKLIFLGIDINQQDASGSTPLMEAVHGNNYRLFDYLLTSSANWKLKDKYDADAFHYACSNGNDKMINRFISLGANVNSPRGRYLDISVNNDDITAVKKLIEHGANPEIPNCRGDNLSLATKFLDIFRFLIEEGFDINKQYPNGDNLLIIACRYASADVVNYIAKHNSVELDINQYNIYGDCALYSAILSGSVECTQILVENGAHIKRIQCERFLKKVKSNRSHKCIEKIGEIVSKKRRDEEQNTVEYNNCYFSL